jgi:prevent-host-death family protein
MKKTTITVTEASRNFAHCLNRVRYQNMNFVLMKNGKPFARIVPENEKVCTGGDLAAALGATKLSAEEARAWSNDLAKARKTLKNPENKWR